MKHKVIDTGFYSQRMKPRYILRWASKLSLLDKETDNYSGLWKPALLSVTLYYFTTVFAVRIDDLIWQL